MSPKSAYWSICPLRHWVGEIDPWCPLLWPELRPAHWKKKGTKGPAKHLNVTHEHTFLVLSLHIQVDNT
jgi:hypothetical protein